MENRLLQNFLQLHMKEVRTKVKYHVIYHYSAEYPVSVMCKFFGVSRSGYYSFVQRMRQSEQNKEPAEIIRIYQQYCNHTYSYRRMWLWLRKEKNIHRNSKTILCIMKMYNLLTKIRRRRKWVQMG